MDPSNEEFPLTRSPKRSKAYPLRDDNVIEEVVMSLAMVGAHYVEYQTFVGEED